ncbi:MULTISPECIES: hypothetical protein [unclassified Bacillus cereus group]|uniref:hypothetical protein n=1 Tax=unclassified Bacillus cereus group TaxID=2750818 RepID=UPI00339859EC
MEKYRVQTEYWISKEFVELKDATDEYERTKDWAMGEGVTEDFYVELVSSNNDFEDYEIVKKAHVVVGEEKNGYFNTEGRRIRLGLLG